MEDDYSNIPWMYNNLVYDERVKNPNQKRVTFKSKPVKVDNDDLYFDRDIIFNAMRKLDAGPFKLFVYLLSRQGEYTLNLSQIAIERTFGIKKNQYYRAIDKLKEAGFLIQINPMVDHFIFDEYGR